MSVSETARESALVSTVINISKSVSETARESALLSTGIKLSGSAQTNELTAFNIVINEQHAKAVATLSIIYSSAPITGGIARQSVTLSVPQVSQIVSEFAREIASVTTSPTISVVGSAKSSEFASVSVAVAISISGSGSSRETTIFSTVINEQHAKAVATLSIIYSSAPITGGSGFETTTLAIPTKNILVNVFETGSSKGLAIPTKNILVNVFETGSAKGSIATKQNIAVSGLAIAKQSLSLSVITVHISIWDYLIALIVMLGILKILTDTYNKI
jgi:epidermal growth factor receptor substrate 15